MVEVVESKYVVGFERYLITSDGEVWDNVLEKYMTQTKRSIGGPVVKLQNHSTKKWQTCTVSRLLVDSFYVDENKGKHYYKDGDVNKCTLDNITFEAPEGFYEAKGKKRRGYNNKGVEVLQGGEVIAYYDSQTDCLEGVVGLGVTVSQPNLSNCLNGKLSSTKGLSFRWVIKNEVGSDE